MPTFEDHPGTQCPRCGYHFRKGDRYELDGEAMVCAVEKHCRRRQRTPKPEYANPDASADEMLDKIAETLTAEVKAFMLFVSENEHAMRYIYNECFSDGQFVKTWKR
jgi:hypothetical protein